MPTHFLLRGRKAALPTTGCDYAADRGFFYVTDTTEVTEKSDWLTVDLGVAA